MKNTIRNLALFLLVMIISTNVNGSGRVIPANYNTVALILSNQSDPVNTPTVELYRVFVQQLSEFRSNCFCLLYS